MVWIFVALGALVVFAIAAAFVGSEAFRLGHETQAAIFDVDEAVANVGESLPPDVQGRLSYDDVRSLILATLDHLHGQGVSAMPGEDLPPVAADVVVAEEEALAVVLGAVEAQGLDIADHDAATVIEALLAHLAEIGALGPRA